MTDEDYEFNRIERESLMRMEAVKAAAPKEKDMSKEAMKLALESLEEIKRWTDRWTKPGHPVSTFAEKAITALREALANEALDRMAENARELGLDYEPAQQEPVEWMELLREARDNCKASIVEANISASRKEYRIDLEARLTAALNTSPPAQRKPLTLQERTSIVRANKSFHDKDEIDAYGVIDDVEAAHGIKDDA